MVSRSGSVLGIVPARGGSKGLPSKNIRVLGGHPLIAYSIASARAARTIDRVIVSTDDERIAEVARAYGAETPFLRPAELASDDAPDFPLFLQALDWLRTHEGYEPAIVVQIRPTSPFRPHGLLDEAVRLLESDDHTDSVRAVTHPKQHPAKMWSRDAQGYIVPFLKDAAAELYNRPRQFLPEVLWQTGHVDAMWTKTIRAQGTLTGKRVKSVFVDQAFVVDIDRLEDLHYAEYLLGRGLYDIDLPRAAGRSCLLRNAPIRLAVLDFDGTMTDDRVWVDQDGRELVACSRSDGLGIELLRKAGVEVVVLSKEANPVVLRRCEKLGISCQQGVNDKLTALRDLLRERQLNAQDVVYMGNDVNDLACMDLAGVAFAPADAHASVREHADYVLSRPGGRGAVREFCEILLAQAEAPKHV